MTAAEKPPSQSALIAGFAAIYIIWGSTYLGIRVAVAAVSLSGIWLERYLAIVPSVNHGAGPALGVPEIGVTAFFAGVFLLAYAWFGARFPMVSPRLAADTLERERHH